jgi:hypothetical protein
VKAFTAIKTVVRELKYLELSNVIGSKILIQSFPSVEKDVQTALQARSIHFLRGLLTAEGTNYGSLKKYRLLDLSFDTVCPLPEADSIDAHFLKNVGYLSDTEDLKDGPILPGCDDAGLLEELIDAINRKAWMVKVFLEDREHETAIEQHRVPGPAETFDLESYFPREFSVKDACLTNCDTVWLFKHFWL